MSLAELVRRSAAERPEQLAIRGPDGDLTYRELDALANSFAHRLRALGVERGDRVGLWLDKGCRTVAAMQGVLRLGAAYVPIDPLSPPMRAKAIVEDCSLKAIVTRRERVRGIDELERIAGIYLDEPDGGAALNALPPPDPIPPLDDVRSDLAFILYTSGSTGKPKGVCISHQNALAFVEWSAETIEAKSTDRFSNHAPFHFDLSVFDLYVAFLARASCHIVPEGAAYVPARAVEFLTKEQITVWYSVPSALMLMMEHGKLLDVGSPPRVVVFAGEPFPIKPLRTLRNAWRQSRFLNFYGPTETNVCTYYEVGDIAEDRTAPVPIGRASCGDSVWAVKDDGSEAGVGEEGELFVSGPTVMMGYWGKPPQGDSPYRTGDLVRMQEDREYLYLGRRDHMVKVRGHRVELGEIESALLTHEHLKAAAVVVAGDSLQARLVAFVVIEEHQPTLLDLKKHCAERVPRYMIIDEVRYVSELPRTINGKIDRLKLSDLAKER